VSDGPDPGDAGQDPGPRGRFFFLSYAHAPPLEGYPEADPDGLVSTFFADLVAAVEHRSSQQSTPMTGFFDKQIPLDSNRKAALRRALSEAQVFVPLYSPRYLNGAWPGREWACFRQRLEMLAVPDPERRFVPVLWTPLPDGRQMPDAIDLAGAEDPDYAENGLRALLKIASYRESYAAVVARLAERIIRTATESPLAPSAVPDIDAVGSAFLPAAPLSVFAVTVAAPTAAMVPDPQRYGDASVAWRPFPQVETPLADFAAHVFERLDFEVRVSGIDANDEQVPRRPGILLIDPRLIDHAGGRAALTDAIRDLPRWVLPVIVSEPPGDGHTAELIKQVGNMLDGAGALPTEISRRAARGVHSLDEFVVIARLLVTEAERQYLRYGRKAVETRSAGEPLRTRRPLIPHPGTVGGSQDGQIVTFYSFKGGTGRSMALANVAWILAANGMRVLAADWDLEAPGLHRFFQPFLESGVEDRPGIIDFVRRYEWAAAGAGFSADPLPDGNGGEAAGAAREAVAALIEEHVKVQDYAIPVTWRFPGSGTLHYLSAGKQDNGAYQSALSALDWDNFYDRLFGGEFFDALRATMKSQYDYVLIDSRTGLSDVADICAVHLPDTVVDCFTLSTQAIEGAAMIAETVRTHSGREIRILPVPMRIDAAEKERADAGQAYAARRLAGLPTGMSEEERRGYWAQVAVPYRAFYAYEETLAAFGDTPGAPGSLLASFERITACITNGAVTGLPAMEESLRLRTRLRFTRDVRPTAAGVMLDFAPADQHWAEWIAAVLAGADIAVHWAGELPAGADVSHEPLRAVAVVAESYLARSRDGLPADGLDLAICVTQVRMPPQLASVPVVFLAGLPEDQAADRLLSHLDASRPEGSRIDAVRYPGGNRPQVLNVPTRNRNFTGRERELRQLREELRTPGSPSVAPVTIVGFGGVGKSQLALEYVHRFGADYDIVWWMNCGQPQYISASLADLGKRAREAFHASVPEEGSVDEVARRVLELLRDGRLEKRWLLVYDNAEDVAAIRPLVPSGGGHVLITSRDGTWRERSRALALDPFTRAEGIRHLRLRDPGLSPEEADRVAELLGDLPLAVAMAGAWLAETGISGAEYLQQLQHQPPSILALGPFADYPETIGRAWDRSLDSLQSRSTAATWLLGLCSVMAPEISLDLVYSRGMAAILSKFDPTITEPVVVGRLIQQIERLALAKLDTNGRQIQVHRLVQAVVRERMSAAIPELERDVHQVLVAERPNGDVGDPRTWPRYRLIWPHLTTSQAALSDQESVRQLLIDRVSYLRQRGDLQRGRRRAAEIESAWKHMLAHEKDPEKAIALRRQLLRLQSSLANIMRDMAEFAGARALDEAVLTAQRELLGADHPHSLMTQNGLAADLRAVGDYAESLELGRRTYQAWTENYGDEFGQTLAAAHGLAVSLRLTGDFRAALAQDRLTLERRTATLGPYHPRTLDSDAAIARDLLGMGRYVEAVAQIEAAVARCREALGDDDPLTFNSRALLGVALRCAGHPEVAEEHLIAARAGLTRGFGGDSSDALTCRVSLALSLLDMRQVPEAAEMVRQVFLIYEERFGPAHPYSLICKLNIAAALCIEEEIHVAALELAQDAANGLADRLGAAHPATLSAEAVRASALARQGHLSEAEAIEADVTAGREGVLGPHHPDTLRSRANHLLTQQEMGAADAPAARRAIAEELAAVLGAEHPDVHRVHGGGRLLSTVDLQPF
jgi:FxsC-like protein